MNMTAETLYELACAKREELGNKVAIKASNKNPDYYKTKREYDLWCVITALLDWTAEDDVPFTEEMETLFKTLSSLEKKVVKIEVHPGDSLLELLQKYNNVNDVYNKLMKAIADNGFTVDNGVIC